MPIKVSSCAKRFAHLRAVESKDLRLPLPLPVLFEPTQNPVILSEAQRSRIAEPPLFSAYCSIDR